MFTVMTDITTILKQNIDQISANIEKLQSQRAALVTALDIVGDSAGGRGRRARSASRRVPRQSRAPKRTAHRRKRGANQEMILKALGRGAPRRLSEIASSAGLNMSGAGGVLRAL